MEHIDPGSRMGHSTVILSPFVALRVNSAKHLSDQSSRPFAAAQGDSVRWLRFMCIGGLLWSPAGDGGVLPVHFAHSKEQGPLPSAAGGREGHPYESSGLRPMFMASVDAYEGRSIGGVRDKSAPTDGRNILFI